MIENGLPREWTRGPQWSSPAARDAWAPVVAAAADAWAQLESLSVSEGLRGSALFVVEPADLPGISRAASGQGLQLSVLEPTRAALHRPGLSQEWHRAWSESDDSAIGKLLGFPACCVDHFSETWVRQRRTDTVLTMRTIDGPAVANVLLRQLGVRLVPHLPCSADCAETVKLGKSYHGLARAQGLAADALGRLLSLPVTYSALRGVAVVETEHFRFMAGTDYTEHEVRVSRRPGTSCGKAAGIDPNVHYDGPSMPRGREERRGHSLEVPAERRDPDTTTAQDNGFSTERAMRDAHAVVVAAVGRVSSAVDLGSGDGTLLARIVGDRDPSQLGAFVGVERDEVRAARGTARYPWITHHVGKIEDVTSWTWSSPADVALLMPGRLLEMGADAAREVRAALPRLGRKLVVYAYGDWLKKHGTIGALARAAFPGESLEVVNIQVGPEAEAATIYRRT